MDDGWDHPSLSRSAVNFLACFLLSNFTDVRRFLLLFAFLTCKIFDPTHTLERKTRKTHTLECKKQLRKSKISHVKNVNKRKYRLTPVKLESKKQDKKVTAKREGLGGKFPSNYRKKPRSLIISIRQHMMKLTCVIYAYKSMFPIGNSIHKTNSSCTETAKFSIALRAMGGNF